MVMSKDADPVEVERLISELDELGPYEGWTFSYEYPGFFCYSHPSFSFNVFFTPDWEGAESLPIGVSDADGNDYEEHSCRLPLPREGRTGQQLLNLVRPTLDKLGKLPPPAPPLHDLHVSLTADEISALPKALEHVRVHMAHEHPWNVRDAAMTAIGKLVAAAKESQ